MQCAVPFRIDKIAVPADIPEAKAAKKGKGDGKAAKPDVKQVAPEIAADDLEGDPPPPPPKKNGKGSGKSKSA